MRHEHVGSRWAVYGCGCGNVKQDVGFGEKEVIMHIRLLLVTAGDGGMRSD